MWTSEEKCSQELIDHYVRMLDVVDEKWILHKGIYVRVGDLIHLDDILECDVDYEYKLDYVNQIYEVTRIRKPLKDPSAPYYMPSIMPSIWIKPLFPDRAGRAGDYGHRPYKLDSIVFTTLQPATP